VLKEGIRLLTEGQEGYGFLVENDSGIITYDLNKELIKENTELVFNGDSIFIKCILQKAGVLNRNGRIYPKPILEREIRKYMEYVKNGNAVGELDHADDLTISLANIPFRIVNIWWEGDTILGELEIFLTKGYVNEGICSDVGDRVAEKLRHKVKLGISSRGIGSVKTVGGKHIVQNDFELVCFDLVASPSTPNAYLFQETTHIKESHIPIIKSVFEDKLKRFIQI
jgi:hypothetical protein